MNKLLTIFVILALTLPLTKDLKAQMLTPESLNKLSQLQQDRLNALFPRITATGFDLNGRIGNKKIAFADTTGVIVRHESQLYLLIATYDFNPSELRSDLKSEFSYIKVLVLKESIEDNSKTGSRKFRALPLWLLSFNDLESLVLDCADLQEPHLLSTLNLKYLCLKENLIGDREKLIEAICEVKGLEFLVHNSLFTSSEVQNILEKRPNLIIMLAK